MYVSPISRRFWFGRLTPAMRATRLPLPLLVSRVGADDHGRSVPLDHPAALTHGFDGRSDLHLILFSVRPARRTRPVRGERYRPRHSGGCAVRLHRSKTGAAARIRGPAAVTATVCSKWAEREPSAVEIDHSSSWRTMSASPAVIIGSIANVMPSASSGPRPGWP